MKKVDKSFAGVLGDSPTVRVWEYLMIGRHYAYHISDIAKHTEVSRPTIYQVLKDLKKKGIVVVAGKKQGATLFKININSREVKIMLRAFQQIIGV